MYKPELIDFGLTESDYILFSKYPRKVQYRIMLTGGIFGILLFLLHFILNNNTQEIIYFEIMIGILGSYILGSILFHIIDSFVNDFFVQRHKFARKVSDYKAAFDNYKRRQNEFWYSLNGFEFEKRIGQLFTSKGYHVKYTPLTNDGGIDLILNKNSSVIIVQCKAHKNAISPNTVRDLYGTLVSYKADSAILVSTSGFTKGVVKFVQNKPIKLMTLKDIIELSESKSR